MKRDYLTKNPKVGYTVAAIAVLIATFLFIAGWTAMGSGFAVGGVWLAIDTASANGHLSKRHTDDTKNL